MANTNRTRANPPFFWTLLAISLIGAVGAALGYWEHRNLPQHPPPAPGETLRQIPPPAPAQRRPAPCATAPAFHTTDYVATRIWNQAAATGRVHFLLTHAGDRASLGAAIAQSVRQHGGYAYPTPYPNRTIVAILTPPAWEIEMLGIRPSRVKPSATRDPVTDGYALWGRIIAAGPELPPAPDCVANIASRFVIYDRVQPYFVRYDLAVAAGAIAVAFMAAALAVRRHAARPRTTIAETEPPAPEPPATTWHNL